MKGIKVLYNYWKIGKLILIFVLLNTFCVGQEFSGSWSGILKPAGQSWENGKVIYLSISQQKNGLSGISRIELFKEAQLFTVKKMEGEIANHVIKLKEKYIKASSNKRGTPNCKLTYSLHYIDSTGYLIGEFRSWNCRNTIGKVVFFRSNHVVNTEDEPTSSHYWAHHFIKNYKKGIPAPEIMKIREKNFKLVSILFDFDKSFIREKYKPYLKKMAQILIAMSDLKVKITGNTDAIGTNGYNIGLSKRRADALIHFFESQGVSRGKLVIDFKGEDNPVASNATNPGRQKNRRVEFQFIYE